VNCTSCRPRRSDGTRLRVTDIQHPTFNMG
jgi:hypothetical protein